MKVYAALALLLLVACSEGRADPPPRKHRAVAQRQLAPTAPATLCATRGDPATVGDRLRIEKATTRVVAPRSSGEAVALEFTYRGESRDVAKLGSGQIRRQLGLKLRAADGCNLVYVMWRLDPKPFIEVSIKRNPGEHTADDCGTGGYTKVKATRTGPLPPLAPGGDHVLAARIDGDRLFATVDGKVVWAGALPKSARALDGVAGLRTDNVAIDAALLTATDPEASKRSIPGCGGH